jgi:hypothetical protein
MCCYYQKHYEYACESTGMERGAWRLKAMTCIDSSVQSKLFVCQDNHWCLFDTRSMTNIGDWDAVRAMCCRTGMQPQTLVYEQVQ